MMEPRNPNYARSVEHLVEVAPFIQDVRIRLVDVGPGWCEMELALLPKHQQQDGYVHAGVLMTLADHTAGSAGTSLVAANEYVLTAEFNISFLHAAQGERLWCRAEVIKPGRRLMVVESSVHVGAAKKSRLVAKARGALAVLKKTDAAGET
jgi:uncharacterized protein (TIGR00369 family)